MTGNNILMVTPFFPPDFGGIAYHVLNITKNLVNLGNKISIIVPKNRNENNQSASFDYYDKIYRISSFYLQGWPYPTLRSISIPKDFGSQIETIIQKGNFDIVHAHGHHYPFSWYALNAAKKSSPILATVKGSCLITNPSHYSPFP